MDDSPRSPDETMENQTSFDLSRAIQVWRRNLAQSAAFRSTDLDELEAHLRDAIPALEAAGLSSEESFLIASRRIGTRHTLESEFGKINPGRAWLNRPVAHARRDVARAFHNQVVVANQNDVAAPLHCLDNQLAAPRLAVVRFVVRRIIQLVSLSIDQAGRSIVQRDHSDQDAVGLGECGLGVCEGRVAETGIAFDGGRDLPR